MLLVKSTQSSPGQFLINSHGQRIFLCRWCGWSLLANVLLQDMTLSSWPSLAKRMKSLSPGQTQIMTEDEIRDVERENIRRALEKVNWEVYGDDIMPA